MYDIDIPIRPGKPRIYETEEDLLKAIEGYFDSCDSRLKTFVDKDGNETTALVPEPYSIAGMKDYIKVNYETIGTYKQLYPTTLSYAYNRIERDTVRRMLETSNQAGAIFYLKNAFGYRDEQQITSTNKTETTVIYRPEKLPETTEGEIVEQPKLGD